MKKIKKISAILVIILVTVLAASCGMKQNYSPNDGSNCFDSMPYGNSNFQSSTDGNSYLEIEENPFVNTSEQPSSMFALSLSTGAYANLRRYINENRAINRNQINIEQIVNYFNYDYPSPTEGKPLSVTPAIFDCPWNENARLLTVGLKAETVQTDGIGNNLVFLLDVSGSMASANKLGLMKQAFQLLVENLNENDTVSIVTYAGSDKVLIDGVKGSEKTTIVQTIETLNANGSTNGASGIQTAYDIAQKHFIEEGNNRVILATDGDFNVGINTISDLESYISNKRSTGVYLTALGFGFGNLRSDILETLANTGNGNYAYIDSVSEARKVLVEEIGGTLNIVARDAKARVDFNVDYVDSYRLLGYENLLLSQEEWQDTETDAGEIGSGFTVTAVYEVIFKSCFYEATAEANFLDVAIRYKSPNTAIEEQFEITTSCGTSNIYTTPTRDMAFISALVETCLLLRNSAYKGTSNMTNVNARLEAMDLSDNLYMEEFRDIAIKIANQYFRG